MASKNLLELESNRVQMSSARIDAVKSTEERLETERNGVREDVIAKRKLIDEKHAETLKNLGAKYTSTSLIAPDPLAVAAGPSI